MLTERRSRILQTLIQEYISTAMAVSSEAILKSSGMKVSSATVRNEMAQLEEEGYIFQPHTSAGRVPTAKGYRYYVEILLEERELPHQEQRLILHQFSQTGKEVRVWTQLAATILSRMLQNVAVVTPPRRIEARLRDVRLISLSPAQALLVIVFDDTSFKERKLSFESMMVAQEDLNAVGSRLSGACSGMTADEIEGVSLNLSEIDQVVYDNVLEMMREEIEGGLSSPHFDGLSQILSQPEFTKNDRALMLMEMLEERRFLNSLLSQAPGDENLRVIIGGESPQSELHGFSVVLGRYGIPRQESGVIGVLGPTRMPYERVFSAVRFLSGAMSGMLQNEHEPR